MTEDILINGILDREGRGYRDQHTHPPIDQPTGPGGVTLPVLSAFRGHLCTIEDLRALTVAESREVIRWKVRQLSAAVGFDKIAYEPLRLEMIDWAYNSGEALATRWLQRVLRVDRTGRLDSATVARVNLATLSTDDALFWLHHAVIMARLLMIDRATDAGTVDKRFEEGLENRALQFSALPVP